MELGKYRMSAALPHASSRIMWQLDFDAAHGASILRDHA
jgi:hypothetical protein